ncbi:unnamed protein product [Rotaria socialis]|uniref:Uncharacterized protein n=1 Tax=Rotaria socialis TaxID=392032 RepID=A0A818N7U3_9BILA|nr:unnamed protein product [Rotaria socialis]
MINLTKRIKKLFEGYDLSMDVRERKGCQTALNDQPIANISDNEDDNDDETANSDTPRFEFDALTASTDSRRLASQRRFQPGRPASGTIPRDFIHQRQFQPNCPPPNINQYCFIPQQQFQPNHATTDTIPRDFISQQQLHFGNTTSLLSISRSNRMRVTMMLLLILIFCINISTTIQSNSTSGYSDVIKIPSSQTSSLDRQCNCVPARYIYRRYQDPIKFELSQQADTFIKIPGLMVAAHHTKPMVYQIRYQGTCWIARNLAQSILTILIDNQVLIANQLLPNSNRRYALASQIGGKSADLRGGSYWYSGTAAGASFSWYKTELVLMPAGTHVIEVGVRAENTILHLWGGELTIDMTEYDSAQYSTLTYPTVWN